MVPPIIAELVECAKGEYPGPLLHPSANALGRWDVRSAAEVLWHWLASRSSFVDRGRAKKPWQLRLDCTARHSRYTRPLVEGNDELLELFEIVSEPLDFRAVVPSEVRAEIERVAKDYTGSLDYEFH